LLTLSALPVTSDGYLLFVERSRLVGSHEGMYQSAVNGNLELRPRAGVGVDLDVFGLPDPLAALCREGAEELGLAMPRASIYTSGLVRFGSTSERGTFLLLTTAFVGATLADVVAGSWRADVIEGRWEVGTRLIAIPVPGDERAAHEVAQWLWNTPNLTPHATAAGLTALGSLGWVVDWGTLRERPAALPTGSRRVDLTAAAQGHGAAAASSAPAPPTQ
jgi:hypothetical protein